MDDHKRRAEELFQQALALQAFVRPQFLDRECAGDRALRWDVEDRLVRAGATGPRGTPDDSIVPSHAPSFAGAPSEASGEWMTAGMTLGKYELIRPLGRGGMGAVFLGRHVQLAQRVAIKALFVHPARVPEDSERLLAEARTTARCRHENIVVIHDVGAHEGRPYMVLEYLEGQTLRQLLR